MVAKHGFAAAAALGLLVSACADSGTMRATNTSSPQSVASSQVLRPIQDRNLLIQPFNVSADRLAEMDVYATNGQRVGGVGDVLADASGRIVGLSVNVGGFLGMGSREVIMPVGQIRMQGDRLITNYSREQIEQLPPYVG